MNKPKFLPDAIVITGHPDMRRKFIIAKVEYCTYNELEEKWKYHLHGWCGVYDETDLTLYENTLLSKQVN